MRSFLNLVAVTLATAASFAQAHQSSNCPTITKTATRCSTCPVEDCIILSSISNPADCPPRIPTQTVSFPCYGGGCGGGCSTQYVYPTSTITRVTKPPSCRGPISSSSTSSSVAVCTPTVTVTTYPGTSAGCGFGCSDSFCVRDDILTLPCGCSQAASVVTSTVKICATSSPCINCYTGFMFTTTATNCPTSRPHY